MYSTKVLLPVAAALASTSLAQSFLDPACTASMTDLIGGGPTMPAVLIPYLAPHLHGFSTLVSETATVTSTATSTPSEISLLNPKGYVDAICAAAGDLPSSVLPEFKSFGSALLSYGRARLTIYDDFVTDCIATGTAAVPITSYLNSILTGTGNLCEATPTPGAGSGTSNGTASVTPAPTSTGASSTIPVTAGAVRPTGVLAGAAAMGGLLGAAALF